jgi:signal peptidase II
MKCSLALATFIGLSILVLDRFSKLLALVWCQETQDLTSFFACNLSFNRGVSWSLFASESIYVTLLLVCLIIGLIVFLGWHAYKRLQENKSITAEVMIIAGAIGNLIDRALYGAVVDFILIHYKTWCFPIFNVADIAITLGVALFIIREWHNA